MIPEKNRKNVASATLGFEEKWKPEGKLEEKDAFLQIILSFCLS